MKAMRGKGIQVDRAVVHPMKFPQQEYGVSQAVNDVESHLRKQNHPHHQAEIPGRDAKKLTYSSGVHVKTRRIDGDASDQERGEGLINMNNVTDQARQGAIVVATAGATAAPAKGRTVSSHTDSCAQAIAARIHT